MPYRSLDFGLGENGLAPIIGHRLLQQGVARPILFNLLHREIGYFSISCTGRLCLKIFISNTTYKRGKALSSSLKLEPLVEYFWLSALQTCIYCTVNTVSVGFKEEGWRYFCRFDFVCFTLYYKFHGQT